MSRSYYRFIRCVIRYSIAVLTGSFIMTANAKEPVMSDTKTYCIGRFLIDVPKEAEINGQGYEFMFGRINSEKTELDAKGFDTRMTNRETEIKSKKISAVYQLT